LERINSPKAQTMTAEKNRLIEDRDKKKNWRKFGPYLTERQWGTVREDYSDNGSAWDYLPHDAARSKAYRWGEEGIAGISDDQQLLCFALALWNKKDPILKERLYGLTGPEGNHAEDCKELYYYLDSTPTHSYMKMLYKYPQDTFPYSKLVDENRRRGKQDPEFEIIDTGVFDQNQYFDVFVEYAKADVDDILIKITAHNRSTKSAPLVVLPTFWFRNTWSWEGDAYRPEMQDDNGVAVIDHKTFDKMYLACQESSEILFCENETNTKRLYNYPGDGTFKDGINDYVVHGNQNAINKNGKGTKGSFRIERQIKGLSSLTIKLRLSPVHKTNLFKDFDTIFERCVQETDEFYTHLQKGIRDKDKKIIQRQALAGMLWSKQFYYYEVSKWMDGDQNNPPPPQQRKHGRNNQWIHLNNKDIISMPDKWEYPWYAAWDLAFHCIPLAMVDPEFAKNQLLLLSKEWYMHPNGQLPAYEWAFGDVNPPVHGWASWRVYKIDQKIRGDKGDRKFLEEIFHKLLLNFTWWVNKKDHNGNNVFQGGFLGMDNIGVFDRSAHLPEGTYIEQSDGTSWMAMFTLNMLRMSLELAKENPTYQSLATKFFEHFLYIAGAIANINKETINLWDNEDEFFYDVLHSGENRQRMKVRSMVGLIPLFAVEVLDQEIFDSMPQFTERLQWFLKNRPDLANLISRWNEKGKGERHLLSLLRGHRMKRLLKRMLDENEFLSEYGIRALSKEYEKHPYVFRLNSNEFTVKYTPAESDTHIFGGNSNWRGPIWFPVNYLIIESLQRFHHYYGEDFKIEHPTGSGKMHTLKEIAADLSERLVNIFKTGKDNQRAVFGPHEKLQNDPHFRNYLLFYEYFHGDNGRGVGASHQTGWTGLVAKLIQPRN
jgi:hypothetical protein